MYKLIKVSAVLQYTRQMSGLLILQHNYGIVQATVED